MIASVTLCCLVLTPAAAQTDPTVPALRVDVSPSNAQPGATIEAALKLFNVTNLYGLQVRCQVDPTFLTGVNHTDGDAFSQSSSYFVDTGFKADGSWLVAASRLQPNPALSGNMIAFKLNYTAQKVGSGTIVCTALGADTIGNGIPLQVINGSVTISPVSATVTPLPVSPTPTGVTLTPTVEQPTATFTPTPAPTDTPTSSPTPSATPTATIPPEITPEQTVSPALVTTISGVAQYQNRPDNSGIKVELLDVNQTALAQVVTKVSGAYTFTDVPSGTYTVRLSAPQNLTLVKTASVPGDGKTVDVGTLILIAGDTNNDDKVDITDASLVGANFTVSVPPAPAPADVTADNTINIRDLVLVGSNFGLKGPIQK
jgi:hypothetical protein